MMRICKSTALALLALTAALTASGVATAAERRPVVVELFTSQGCSSCPAANANLIEGSRGQKALNSRLDRSPSKISN